MSKLVVPLETDIGYNTGSEVKLDWLRSQSRFGGDRKKVIIRYMLFFFAVNNNDVGAFRIDRANPRDWSFGVIMIVGTLNKTIYSCWTYF